MNVSMKTPGRENPFIYDGFPGLRYTMLVLIGGPLRDLIGSFRFAFDTNSRALYTSSNMACCIDQRTICTHVTAVCEMIAVKSIPPLHISSGYRNSLCLHAAMILAVKRVYIE